MKTIDLLNRRSFMDRSLKLGLGVALASLVDIPLVVKRALAEGNIGLNGKKLLFIFLRGANDALNSVVPIMDPAYVDLTPGANFGRSDNRPNIVIPPDAATNYGSKGMADFPQSSGNPADPNYATYWYAKAIRLGDGFSALHPSLKFLAPVYNAGELALIHRVGYPRQSRSHFDSQIYWENGAPGDNLTKTGIFYRALIESGLTRTAPLTGVSIQSALPLLLRGSDAALTNLTDPTRYSLLGVPSTNGLAKATTAIAAANQFPYADKQNRGLLNLQYENLAQTLDIFSALNFTDAGNLFTDDAATDGDFPYYLFPSSNAKNGGYTRPGGGTDASKYVVDTGAYSFFNNLKAAAMILNKTDAIIAGTEIGGFDTHQNQGSVTGSHANLMRRIGWAVYALRKYFTKYADKAAWNDVVVITLSEFGRTTIQNSDTGTDHAEAGLMLVAGGAVKGYGRRTGSAVIAGNPDASVPWVPGATGSMFGVSNRYLKRAVDYRSVLGEIVRTHLGATQGQLDRIIPGYAVAGERLLAGGTSSIDGTPVMGEVGLF
jgi:uncharacterized protein (DUF1501 family)